jgi:hypothetical protein
MVNKYYGTGFRPGTYSIGEIISEIASLRAVTATVYSVAATYTMHNVRAVEVVCAE